MFTILCLYMLIYHCNSFFGATVGRFYFKMIARCLKPLLEVLEKVLEVLEVLEVL